MAFRVKDEVHVPEHGVGIVREIRKLEIDGQVYRMIFIEILGSGLVYSVPESQVEARGIRAVGKG